MTIFLTHKYNRYQPVVFQALPSLPTLRSSPQKPAHLLLQLLQGRGEALSIFQKRCVASADARRERCFLALHTSDTGPNTLGKGWGCLLDSEGEIPSIAWFFWAGEEFVGCALENEVKCKNGEQAVLAEAC